jgi:phosphoglucosamine mutase
VDEKGNVVSGDHILYILGKNMARSGELDRNTVVTTVMSNLGLYKALEKAGIQYAQTQVGDRFVYEYMTANGCRLGGEQSGHIIISKYATTGDGILTSLKLMEVMLAQKQTLSQLYEGLTIYPQELKSVRVKDQKAALAAPAVKAAIEEVKQELGNTGRILVRCSGTEPVVRVMVEAPTQQICKAQVEKIAQLLQQADQNL